MAVYAVVAGSVAVAIWCFSTLDNHKNVNSHTIATLNNSNNYWPGLVSLVGMKKQQKKKFTQFLVAGILVSTKSRNTLTHILTVIEKSRKKNTHTYTHIHKYTFIYIDISRIE